jgi:ribosome maturation factor RimP
LNVQTQFYRIGAVIAGWSSLVARRAHNPKVVGSNPAPATKKHIKNKTPLGVFYFQSTEKMKSHMKQAENTLQNLLTSLIVGMGYEFVGCELNKSRNGSLLRIYIDKPKGVTVDDCSLVSRQVSAMLDVEDPIQGKYTLEVSSPGLERPLFEIAHYQKYLGSNIRVRLYAPLDGRRNFVGVLLRVEEAKVVVKVDETEFALAFSNIEKAKLVANIAGDRGL